MFLVVKWEASPPPSYRDDMLGTRTWMTRDGPHSPYAPSSLAPRPMLFAPTAIIRVRVCDLSRVNEPLLGGPARQTPNWRRWWSMWRYAQRHHSASVRGPNM